MHTNSKGFTLLEVLIVILIFGILAAVALPEYMKAIERARMAEIVTVLGNIAHAQQRKYMNLGRYIDNFSVLDITLDGASGSLFYTRGNPTTGENCNGYALTLHSGNYDNGYADAKRYLHDRELRYEYTVRRMYNSPHTTCLSDQTLGQTLCADFCGIDTIGPACCSDGTPAECSAH